MSNLAKSEGVAAALSFVKDPPQKKEEKVTIGRAIIDGLVNQAGVLKELAGVTSFYLGGIIFLWKKEELWKEVEEYEEWWQFGDFCKTILKMSLQKANDLIRIWNRAQRLGIEPEKIERIGWAKAMWVMRAAKTKDKAELLIEEAEGMSQEQFMEKVKAQVQGNKFDSSRKYRKLFLLTQDEVNFVDETIEYAATEVMKKDLGPEVSLSEVLVFILTNWRETVSLLRFSPKETDVEGKTEDEWFQAMKKRLKNE